MQGQLAILGFPVSFTEHLNVAGDLGDVLLCSPRSMLVGLSKNITVDVSTDRYFEEDATAFRMTLLCDHTPFRETSLTLADGSTVVSDAVVLEAR